MFECAQAYPEYNALCEGNKRGKDHRGTENAKSKRKRRNSDPIFAMKAESDVSWAQNKREALAFQNGHRAERVKQTDEAK